MDSKVAGRLTTCPPPSILITRVRRQGQRIWTNPRWVARPERAWRESTSRLAAHHALSGRATHDDLPGRDLGPTSRPAGGTVEAASCRFLPLSEDGAPPSTKRGKMPRLHRRDSHMAAEILIQLSPRRVHGGVSAMADDWFLPHLGQFRDRTALVWREDSYTYGDLLGPRAGLAGSASAARDSARPVRRPARGVFARHCHAADGPGGRGEHRRPAHQRRGGRAGPRARRLPAPRGWSRSTARTPGRLSSL